ncbi:MAG TPA: DoxX family protein [Devosia sp.]|jgi:putative oxidoreductase|uniref:DoxX family protein n=1 Tax=Devosia sp. TaxID=1871048 RepID=UPI002DDD7F84|nr:DoxX family protein [Devosia sp.]HEV2516501.1 DoxX family protein [Devosia sp.]
MFSTLIFLAHLLLGGAFVVFGIRNIKAIPGLASFLAGRKVIQPETAARFGVALQIVGGALVVLAPFVPFAGVLGGLALILFLVLATLLFHPFWEFSGEEQKPHVQSFIMNSGLTGAFLLVIAYGL